MNIPSGFNLQPTTMREIPRIMEIVRQAQEKFRLAGINQWQNGYPDEAVFLNDIQNGHSFVLFEGDALVATVMISFDGEPTYENIEGEWLSSGPYAVIHRIAVAEEMKGRNMAGIILQYVAEMCRLRGVPSIRIDTHKENMAMQRVAQKEGFTHCGVITLRDGAPRLAYEKLLF